jgi:predicted Zn-dependent protease
MDDSPAFESDGVERGADDGAGSGAETDVRASGPTDEGEPGTPGEPVVDVGVLVAHSPGGDAGALGQFAERIVGDAAEELAVATDAKWRVHTAKSDPLADRAARRPSEFLDEAALHMVERPYDLVVVVTDVPTTTRSDRTVAGLASPVSRVVVVSTRRLLRPLGRESTRTLDSEPVRWNAATLVTHLLGHVLGADHGDGGVMAPFSYDPSRRGVPSFDADVRNHLRRIAERVPEESVSRGRIRGLAFHALSLVRNPGTVASTLLHSRAPLIPFSLPRLSTAAVTPTLILVFSAEAWDVGLNLSNLTAVLFAVGSIVAAAVHLLYVQRLSFPREHSQVITEHMALMNVTVFCILVLAMVGLFALVGSIILLIELAVFPPNLMTNWPSLEDPSVSLVDLVRVGVFISTLGVLSGALAGGIENRMALRHLALFLDRP